MCRKLDFDEIYFKTLKILAQKSLYVKLFMKNSEIKYIFIQVLGLLILHILSVDIVPTCFITNFSLKGKLFYVNKQ